MSDTPQAQTPPASSASATAAAVPPRFVTGSLLRHIAVMAGTGAIGLVAIFAVDLINLLYLSLLGDQDITAAVGFAGVVGFFHLSLYIGVMIGMVATLSRRIGARQHDEARALASSALAWVVIVSLALTVLNLVFLDPLLRLLGAQGRALELAHGVLVIVLPSTVLLGVGMACTAVLRSVGDARRSMLVTLLPALATTLLDPLFIFVFDLGLTGAALVLLIARCVLAGVGLHGAWKVHHMLHRPDPSRLLADARTLGSVTGPAVLTNLATPVGAAYVTHSIAAFGASAVAGQATIERLTPVAFGVIYSLSGAVGPVLGQNLGAKQFERVRQGLRASLGFMVLAVLAGWLALALLQGPLVRLFGLEGTAAAMVYAFCSWIAGSFLFMGALFVANAAFNNLGKPLWSTGFNWARATLGTIPFAWWGAQYGAVEVLWGQAAGAVVFGSLAMGAAFYLVARLGPKPAPGQN
ncbi:MATE family efflux transporter [Curvibacter sp. APW13]|uniref:MATE family efflux transporter n=1 Tax=Curvibacter sp. APW13 TaxID=3077236 RepID=UPI0028DE4EC7|nr:MATE family efflux transporter [Curvibacter sp. APW13]MDT8993060.1 MATE family efflux transporter [Curvibacter sp. APW13]